MERRSEKLPVLLTKESAGLLSEKNSRGHDYSHNISKYNSPCTVVQDFSAWGT